MQEIVVRDRRRLCRRGIPGEQVGDVGLCLEVEARDERIDVGVGPDLGRVEEELAAPDQPDLLAQVDDLLKEALEDVDPESLPDAGQAGVVGQRLIEGVAQVSAVGEVEGGGLDQAALGTDPLERT